MRDSSAVAVLTMTDLLCVSTTLVSRVLTLAYICIRTCFKCLQSIFPTNSAVFHAAPVTSGGSSHVNVLRHKHVPRRAGIIAMVGIYPHKTRFNRVRNAVCSGQIRTPYSCTQTILACVGEGHTFLLFLRRITMSVVNEQRDYSLHETS